ncbi:hypothetical protein [Glutamicibacter sp. PS]|uniref:hypothetical protein n=1 Tax=Glutamicibacter TaxID=1742989 RepID=UPI002840B79A|nr:hypothetical protein [Glutamicibacter sp. PS]MDR4534174.1 hypothetical protein [Glutamicibacter sp. PS]
MNIEFTVATALATLLVLAVISVFLVLAYRRTQAEEIRKNLVKQAKKLGLAAPEDLETKVLQRRVREAKKQQKQEKHLKTA